MTVQPLARVIVNIAGEMKRLGHSVALLESALAPQIAGTDGAPSRSLRAALQEIDRLSQSISGLSDFLAQLSAQVPAQDEVDTATALAMLTLGEMRGRLSGAGRTAESARPPPRSGHVELL